MLQALIRENNHLKMLVFAQAVQGANLNRQIALQNDVLERAMEAIANLQEAFQGALAFIEATSPREPRKLAC